MLCIKNIGVIVFMIGVFYTAYAANKVQQVDDNITDLEPLLLSAIVNYQNLNSISLYYYDQKHKQLYAPRAVILGWGIKQLPKNLTDKMINGEQYFLVSAIKGLNYSIDIRRLEIKLNIPIKYFDKNLIQFGNRNILKSDDSHSIYGAYLNYNIFSLYGNDQSIGGNAFSTAGLFTPLGTVSQSFLVQPNNFNQLAPAQEELVFLNTQWRMDSPNNLMTYIIGDSTTTAANWSGSAAFFGFNMFKNYATNPNIITFPQPNIVGNAVMPSNVELKVNNIPISSQKIGAGDFEFNNVPVLTGAGTIAVKSTNILGETNVTFVPYFTSPNLLAEGLDTFALQTGLLRQNFGTESFDYGEFLTVGNYAIGVNNSWTSAFQGELLATQQSVGSVQTFAIGAGEGSLAIATSHEKNSNFGVLSSVGYQYALGFNIGGSLTLASSNFTNVGLLNANTPAPIYTLQAFVSYALPYQSRLSLNYFRSKFRPGTNSAEELMSDEINFSYNTTLFKQFNFSVNALVNLRDGEAWQLLASIQYVFDDSNNTIGLDSNYQDGQERYGLALQGSTTGQRLGTNYNVSVSRQNQPDFNNTVAGNINLDSQYGDFTGQTSISNIQQNASIRIAQSIVFLKGDFYLTEPINTSVALIQANELPNTKIYYNNQDAGFTDDEGKLLVPNLAAFNNNRFMISPSSLPLDTVIKSKILNVVPEYLTANLANFNIKHIRTVVIELVDMQTNKLIPLGSKAIIKQLGQSHQYLIGYGGILYLEEIPKDVNILTGEVYFRDKKCKFSVNLPYGKNNSIHERVPCILVKN